MPNGPDIIERSQRRVCLGVLAISSDRFSIVLSRPFRISGLLFKFRETLEGFHVPRLAVQQFFELLLRLGG